MIRTVPLLSRNPKQCCPDMHFKSSVFFFIFDSVLSLALAIQCSGLLLCLRGKESYELLNMYSVISYKSLKTIYYSSDFFFYDNGYICVL